MDETDSNDLFYYVVDPSIPRPSINGLQMIADSLTHLFIRECQGAFELGDVLESCPNLVSLTTWDVIPEFSSSSYPKISHLALYDFDAEYNNETMIDLLSMFPSLLSFEVTPAPSFFAAILAVLHDHCPYLQLLYFGETPYHLDKIDVHPNRKGSHFNLLGR